MAFGMSMDDIMEVFNNTFKDLSAEKKDEQQAASGQQPQEQEVYDDGVREVYSPQDIRRMADEAYDLYNADDYEGAKSLLDAILDQEHGNTPANAMALIALMCYWGYGYERSLSDAYVFARRAFLANMKLGAYVLARVYSERKSASDRFIARELCRYLGDYRLSQALSQTLEEEQLDEKDRPPLYIGVWENGHLGGWDLMIYAYARALQGDTWAALWCGKYMRRKRFRSLVSDETILNMYKKAAENDALYYVPALVYCADAYAAKGDYATSVSYWKKVHAKSSDTLAVLHLLKAYRLGRGVVSSANKIKEYVVELVKRSKTKEQKIQILQRYMPEAHDSYLRAIEALRCNNISQYRKLMTSAVNGYHALAMAHYGETLVRRLVSRFPDVEDVGELDPYAGEKLMVENDMKRALIALENAEKYGGITSWRGWALMGMLELMKSVYVEYDNLEKASYYFAWGGMEICSGLCSIASGIYQDPKRSKDALDNLENGLRYLRNHIDNCRYKCSQIMATMLYGLALHRVGHFLDDDAEDYILSDRDIYKAYLYKYEDEQDYVLYERWILPVARLVDEEPRMAVLNASGFAATQVEKLQRGGRLSHRYRWGVHLLVVLSTVICDIYNDDNNPDFVQEKIDSELASILTGFGSFVCFLMKSACASKREWDRASNYGMFSEFMLGFPKVKGYGQYFEN